MTITSWTEQELKSAVEQSTSIAQTLKVLGLRPAGGNYRSIKKFIEKYGIDTSHFGGQSWSKGQKIGPRRELEAYFSNEYPITSDRLRKRMIAEGVKEARCESCGLSEWLGDPIPLELDHIDGNHLNNELDNLAMLCPNCHALTPTYRGKNIKKPL